MAAVAEGSASAAAKEVEYQAGVQKLVDLLSKLNLAAKEFVPSAAVSPPKKALSADAPVFDYYSIRGGNGATDAAFYVGFGNQHRRDLIAFLTSCLVKFGFSPVLPIDRSRSAVVGVTLWEKVTEERLADIFATCGQVVDCRICGDPHSALRNDPINERKMFQQLVRAASQSAVFFSYIKSANSAFTHGLSAKRTEGNTPQCFLLTPIFYLIWSTAMPAAFSEHYERPMD